MAGVHLNTFGEKSVDMKKVDYFPEATEFLNRLKQDEDFKRWKANQAAHETIWGKGDPLAPTWPWWKNVLFIMLMIPTYLIVATIAGTFLTLAMILLWLLLNLFITGQTGNPL